MEQETTRKCIVNGKAQPKEQLLRFAVTDDNQLIPDFNKKIPGRGLYVSNSRQILQKAITQNLFIKSAKRQLNIPEDFLALVENLLYKRGLNAINLARKAGALVTGFEKVKDKVLKNKAAFLIEANNAGQDGREKIAALLKNIEVFDMYHIDDLDKALDKVNTVHVAVMKGDVAEMVYTNLKRYQTFLD